MSWLVTAHSARADMIGHKSGGHAEYKRGGHVEDRRGRSLGVAVLLSGRSKHCAELVQPVWRSIGRHLIDVLAVDATVVSTFLCMDERDAPPSEEAVKRLRVVQIERRKLQPGDTLELLNGLQNWTPSYSAIGLKARARSAEVRSNATISGHDRGADAASYGPQWARWGRCYGLALEHEQRTGVRFDWFVRTRPDLLFLADIPPLHSYSPHAVSLRASAVHGSPNLTDTAAVHNMTSLHTPLTRGCYKNPHHCAREQLPQPCLVADDQFAMVPRHLGRAYFLHEPLRSPALAARASLSRFYIAWGNASVCAGCFDCQRKFCQEFLHTQLLDRLSVPLEMRGFAARLWGSQTEQGYEAAMKNSRSELMQLQLLATPVERLSLLNETWPKAPSSEARLRLLNERQFSC